MPFYDQYRLFISSDFSKKLLKEYAKHFPGLDENSEKINSELEQVFINYAVLLLDENSFQSCEQNTRWAVKTQSKSSVATKFSIAIKRREIIEKLFFEANEELRRSIGTRGISDLSLETLNSITMDKMFKCFDALEPPLSRVEL